MDKKSDNNELQIVELQIGSLAVKRNIISQFHVIVNRRKETDKP